VPRSLEFSLMRPAVPLSFFVFQNHLFSLFESRKKRGYLLSIGEEKRGKELGI